ncbi:Holliday junction branch migration DNA helicase RuvB [Botrimarina sp.]|uniref:Holliday junction branch migration DNA helicase RuvB n=1 Tax=Botrimarina sp. TaxID=2795802 RepID=UPI0032EAF7FC
MPRETILTAESSEAPSIDLGHQVVGHPVEDHQVGGAQPEARSLTPADPSPVDDLALRPRRLRDIVGQRDVCERVQIAVEAAARRREPLGHVLLDGPPGLGKTTFATCIPRELDVSLQIASGAALAAPKDLLPYLTNAEEGSVLFIDEIHRLPKAVEEFMYPAMEDFRVDITLGEGVNARTVNLKLRPMTIIGATTRSGLLSAPLRDRFPVREHLDFYSIAELTRIVTINAKKLGLPIVEEAAQRIATASRGTPRIANNRLRWVRDYAQSRADGEATISVTDDALAMLGVDQRGLDPQDRKYMETILRVFHGGPAGVEAIAHTMNLAVDTLTDEVEPFLLRSELVVRTPRGRKLTPKAYEHLGQSPPDEPSAPGPRLF